MRAWLLGCTLALGACVPVEQTPATPPQLPRTLVAYERMALFEEGPGQARLRGFDGAAPAGTRVEVQGVRDGATLAFVTADAWGRFDVRFGAELNEEVQLQATLGSTTATPLSFTVRARSEALGNLVRERLAGTGATPNRVVFPRDTPAEGTHAALVVLSGDNGLDNVNPEDGLRMAPYCALPDKPGTYGAVVANPWSADAANGIAVVTRYLQSGIAAVRLADGEVAGESTPDFPVMLDSPLHLDPAVDVNGDGNPESDVNELVPVTPTDVAVVGRRAFVAYANVLSGDRSGRAQFGPGMLAVHELDANGLPTGAPTVHRLQFINPQHVVPTPDGTTVVVSSTGGLQRLSSGWTVESDGGLEAFDAGTLARLHTINLGGFAPSRPVMLAEPGVVYVPSVLRAQLAKVDLGSGQVLRGPGGRAEAIRLEDNDSLRTVFECGLHPTGLVFCGIFDSDALVVVDSADDVVGPWPFTDPIPIPGSSGGLKAGVQSLAVRPGRNGVDHTGNDLLVLLSLANRVAGVDTRFVLGP